MATIENLFKVVYVLTGTSVPTYICMHIISHTGKCGVSELHSKISFNL